jgi:hypothetical protein
MRARNVAKAAAKFDITTYARRYETIAWTLKNTVGPALPYDPGADTDLLPFADADALTPEQRHRASFFVNHISPLLQNNARTELPDGHGDVLATLAAGAPGPVVDIGSRSRDRGHGLAPEAPAPGLVIVRECLTHEQVTDALTYAGRALAPGGVVALTGCGDRAREAAGPGLARRGAAASALLAHMSEHFPLWRTPFQVGTTVVLRRR